MEVGGGTFDACHLTRKFIVGGKNMKICAVSRAECELFCWFDECRLVRRKFDSYLSRKRIHS